MEILQAPSLPQPLPSPGLQQERAWPSVPACEKLSRKDPLTVGRVWRFAAALPWKQFVCYWWRWSHGKQPVGCSYERAESEYGVTFKDTRYYDIMRNLSSVSWGRKTRRKGWCCFDTTIRKTLPRTNCLYQNLPQEPTACQWWPTQRPSAPGRKSRWNDPEHPQLFWFTRQVTKLCTNFHQFQSLN